MDVWVVQWEERDSWSGPGDSWYTFHLTEEDGKKAIEKHWAKEKKNNPSGKTPDYYIRNDGNPKKHAVSDRIFKLIEDKQLNQFEGSLSQLENFQPK